MAEKLSLRLAEILDALPLAPGMRVLEIGCGPGALARAVASCIGDGFVLGIDRSATAIAQAERRAAELVASRRLAFRVSSAETFSLAADEAPFDLAFAIRVGALDGRHPKAGEKALASIKAALKPGGRLLIDGGTPLRDVPLD